jgi:hypothetical protein
MRDPQESAESSRCDLGAISDVAERRAGIVPYRRHVLINGGDMANRAERQGKPMALRE